MQQDADEGLLLDEALARSGLVCMPRPRNHAT
jgi:hypothetical protein